MRHKGIIKKNLRPRCSITDPFETFWYDYYNLFLYFYLLYWILTKIIKLFFRPLLDPENSKILINEMEK